MGSLFFFQHIILYYFKKGKNTTEIQKKICAVYGEGAVNELVYEAIVMVLESTGESTFKMILDLLKSLWKSSTSTVDQMKRGYERIYNEIPDINLDVPYSYYVFS